MSVRTPFVVFALVGLALAVASAVGAIIIRLVTQAPFLPVEFGFGPAAMVAFIVMGLSWASIGAFLVIRRPENAVGRVMVVAGAGYALDLERLGGELGAVVGLALAPTSVVVWLRPSLRTPGR